MRIVANESHIKTRMKIGERAPFVGLLVLVAAAVLLFVRQELMWASMALVWVGFLVSLVGSYLGERYVGPLAYHKRVPELLKGLDNSYTLLLHKLPVPCVLLESGGVTVFTVKTQGGLVTYQDGKWQHRQKMGFLRRFAGQESLARPDQMAHAEREIIEAAIARHLPEAVEVPVKSLILFTHPEVTLEIDNDTAPVPAIRGVEVKRWLRKNAMRPQLAEEARTALEKALGVEPEDAG